MNDNSGVNRGRRNLVIATACAGGAAAVATVVPLATSMLPSERAKALGAPVEVDISKLQPGEMATVEWQGKPVWIIRRTKEMLDGIKRDNDLVVDPESDVPQQPDYARNEYRSVKEEYAVLVGVCTHLGCSPQYKAVDDKAEMGPGWNGGFYCPCHGSKFDFAGRVFKGVPAPINLRVPKYAFLSDTTILIGEDRKGA
jgi:ubiquinol-cytochrome c reductase iron-sulfur subunit